MKPLNLPDNEIIQKQIAEVLFKITYGLFVVSSIKDGRPNAQVCNTVFQITSSPARIAIGINKNNLTNEYIKASGVLAINIIGINDHDIIRRFGYRSGRVADKFESVGYTAGKNGAPILDDCIAYIECRVSPEMIIDVGTHDLFIAEVQTGSVLRDVEPMTYSYFRRTKRGNTGRKKEKLKWVCKVCGQIFESEKAPEKCQVCSVEGDNFIQLSGTTGQTVENLRIHWDAETEEAALYLAFGKKAEEEGFPEIGEAFYRVAKEEAWHAADLAQLQDKVRTTRENLAWLVDTESRNQKSKAEAAIVAGNEGEPRAKEFFVRAAKDEGRHASIFKGLLKRYFGE